MTRTPSGARSLGMDALTTSGSEGSSRISRSSRALLAPGKRFAKPAARSSSGAKKQTRSPPARIIASVWPLTWS